MLRALFNQDHIKEYGKDAYVNVTYIVVTAAVAYDPGEGVTPTCFLLTHGGCVGLSERTRLPHEQNLPPRRPTHGEIITSPLHLATSALKPFNIFGLFHARDYY